MLTKEECLKELDNLYILCDRSITMKDRDNAHIKLYYFIEEHFDNPSLTLEELKPNMWVWDNKIKQYYQISCLFKDNREMATYGLMNGFILYEENRFYRKQVTND